MINYILIYALAAALVVSMITVIAELFTKRNSPVGRIFRAIRIRLREISRTSFCVTAILLLFWGLVCGDPEKETILCAVILVFAILLVLHPEDIINLKKRRKKATLLPLAKLTPLTAGKTKILSEMTPMSPAEEKNAPTENTDNER